MNKNLTHKHNLNDDAWSSVQRDPRHSLYTYVQHCAVLHLADGINGYKEWKRMSIIPSRARVSKVTCKCPTRMGCGGNITSIWLAHKIIISFHALRAFIKLWISFCKFSNRCNIAMFKGATPDSGTHLLCSYCDSKTYNLWRWQT